MSIDVLTVDYNDPDASKKFENSLKSSGFAIIKNHPIDKDLISKVYNEWVAFFNSKETSLTETLLCMGRLDIYCMKIDLYLATSKGFFLSTVLILEIDVTKLFSRLKTSSLKIAVVLILL